MKPNSNSSKNRYFHYQREIINIISEPSTFIDKKHNYIFVNRAFNRFFKYETKDIAGKNIQDVWQDSEFGKHLKTNIQKCLKGKEVSVQYEGEIPGIDFRILEMNYYPHYNKDETIDGIILIKKDVTKHIQAERKLKESETRLRELNATKNKLFSVIGHDLQGPLSNITGFSELIENGYDSFSDEEIRHYNRIIYTLSQSVSESLINILAWARSQKNQIKLIRREISLNLIIEKCLSLLMHNLQLKNIKFENTISPDATIYADEELMTVVFRNLISNAIKFTHRGGTITLTIDLSGDQAIVGVRDTGIGIPPERLNNIFKAINNHTIAGTEGESGTGLGLAISKDFIEKNNGRIWIESTPGKGSVVYFSIPATISKSAEVNCDNK